MRKKCLVCALLFLLVCGITARAATFHDADSDVTFEVPDDYITVTADTLEDRADYLETLGQSVDSFRSYFTDDGLLLFAALPDRSRQIQLKWAETDFAREIGELSLLDDETVAQVAQQIIGAQTRAVWNLIESGDLKCYEIRTATSDSGGRFCSVQYVTIRNGRFYSLTCYSAGDRLTETDQQTARDLLAALSIHRRTKTFNLFDAETILLMVLICAAILAGLVVVGYLIYSFIADLRRRDDSADGESERIKRRKF